MTTHPSLRSVKQPEDWRLKQFTSFAAATAMLIGALVLTGWLFDIDLLKSVLPGLSSMKANTALGLVAAGAALLLLAEEHKARWRQRLGCACAVVVLLLGLLTLGEYLFAVDFGIDQLLFREAPGAVMTSQPGRMGINTAAVFFLLAASLLLLDARTRAWARVAQGMTLAGLLIAMAALIGYGYGVAFRSRLASSTNMALHTAVTFVVLTMGTLTARPQSPFITLLRSSGAGGVLARRMWPQMIFLFALLGWLRLAGERARWYETYFGTALHVLVGMILVSFLIWRAAHELEKLDTERKAAEESEREIDARMLVTLRSIGDAVIATDNAGRVRFMNFIAESLTGWTQAEANGRPLEEIFRIVNEQTRATVENPVTKVMREGVIVGLANHTILLAKDGREIPIDDSGAPIRNEAGEIVGAVLVFRDISERRRADKAKSHLAAIVESSDDAIISKDLNGVIMSWNKGAERLFGYTMEEAVGQSITMLIPSERIEEEARVLETIRRGEKISHYETVRKRKDGSLLQISLTVSPLRDEAGEIVGASKIAHDITARKQAEEVRRKLEYIFNHAGWAVAVADAVDSRLEMVNPAFTAMHGYTVEELIGTPLADTFAPESCAELHRHIAAVHDLGDYKYESIHQRKDGSTFPVLAHVTSFRDEAGKILYRAATFLDLTERKRAEEVLRKSEERLRLATETAEMFAWEVDLRTGSSVVSDNFEQVVGVSSAAFPMSMENAITSLIHPDDASQVAASVAEAISGGDVWRREYRLQSNANGATRWVESQARVIRATDSTPMRFIGVTQNITARKRTEANLAFLADISQALTVLVDERETLKTCAEKIGEHFQTTNCAFAEFNVQAGIATVLYDWRRDDTALTLVGTYRMEEFVTREIQVMLAAGEPVVIPDIAADSRVHNKDAHQALGIAGVLGTSYVSEGRLKAAIGVNCSQAREWRQDEVELLQEVTRRVWTRIERVRVESALERSESKFRQLANAVPQIVWVSRADGILEYVNEQWLEFSGLTLAQTNDPNILAEIIHPDDRETMFNEWAKAMAAAAPYEVEARIKNKQGVYRWFLIRTVPVKDAHGSVSKWFGTSTDITANKSVEARERQAREMAEAANRLKDEFLATVSHELRTPLNHMLGWVIMLRLGKLAPEKAAEALETIERNARAQNRLVEDLLDVSRIVTGKMQLKLQPVIPATVIEAAITSARPAAEAKGLRLQVKMDSRFDTISGDPDRLQQVVWNLVSNAIKFTPVGGRIQVRLERINSHIKIIVSDSGEGIAPEFLPYIFNRFSQADSSIKRKHGGLGLGLAIVRHLVELHGGEVSAESPGFGQGATFTIKLPLSVLQHMDDVQKGLSPSYENLTLLEDLPRLDGVRVLVVDDEADERLLLATMLADTGADLRTAGSITEAISTLDGWRPDVLVSDIGMPNGDGYELLREIRKRDGKLGQWLPAVALTAYARSEDRVRALAAGFQTHVAKPVEPRELLMVIANLAGRGMRN